MSVGSNRRLRVYSPEQRRAAVEAYAKSGLTQEAFSRTWGITTTTLSTWLRLVRDHGPQGLEPRPRKKGSGGFRNLAQPVREEIARTKREFPDFGLKKVRDFLWRFRGLKVSTGSVRKTLRAEGIAGTPAAKTKARKRPIVRRFERSKPLDLWQSDITSFVLTRHSQRVYLTAFLDDYSRYVVSWGLHLHQKGDIVTEALLEGIGRFGKPKEVLTDQGRQYFTWRGKGDFQKLLDREGIRHVVSRTHHPQTLGKCERFWETVGNEFWARVQPQDLAEARERLSHFISHYNHFRPHQGIEGLVPADRFFGAENALRKSLEAQMANHEISLALGESPRKSVFLFGQIGDRQVSVHGEKGKLVIQTPAGREVVGYEEMGISKGDDDEHGGRQTDASDEKEETGEAAAPGGGGAGTLGDGERGGEGAGASHGGLDPGALAGSGEQAGSGGETLGPCASGLAAFPAGGIGYGGGSPQAAALEEEGRLARESARRPQEASQADLGSGNATADCDGSGESAARDARQSGREIDAVGGVGKKKEEGTGEGFAGKWERGCERGEESLGPGAVGSPTGLE